MCIFSVHVDGMIVTVWGQLTTKSASFLFLDHQIGLYDKQHHDLDVVKTALISRGRVSLVSNVIRSSASFFLAVSKNDCLTEL